MKSAETARSEAFWAQRRDDGGAWLAHYFHSASAPHRDVLVNALAPLAPFLSLCEMGCHCGPNLLRLREAFGHFRYVGVDVNAEALAFGRHVAQQAGEDDHTEWIHASLLDLPVRPAHAKAFDVVLTSSCLSVIGPDDVTPALERCLRLTNRVLAIQEPDKALRNGAFQQWGHDYAALLTQTSDAAAFRWTRPGDGTVLLGTRFDG